MKKFVTWKLQLLSLVKRIQIFAKGNKLEIQKKNIKITQSFSSQV